MKRFGFVAILAAVGAFSFSGSAVAQETFRLCTGSAGNPYHESGLQIAKMAGQSLGIEVIETQGTWDNIQQGGNGQCDAFIGQPDGTAYLARSNPGAARGFRKIATLHREYAHVLCSRASGVTDLDQLPKDPKKYSVALGKEGSGAWLLWQNFIAEDEKYGQIPVTPESGVIGLSAVATNQTTCMVVPAGVGNKVVSEANAAYKDEVTLVPATDKDFNDAKDIDGSTLYEFTEIPAKAYPGLTGGWFGGGSSVKTVSWRAGVYVNTSSPAVADEKVFSNFITAVNRAKPAIIAAFEGK